MVLCRSIKLPMAWHGGGDDDVAMRLEAVAATSHAAVDAVGVNLLGAADLVQNRFNFV